MHEVETCDVLASPTCSNVDVSFTPFCDVTNEAPSKCLLSPESSASQLCPSAWFVVIASDGDRQGAGAFGMNHRF